MSLFAIAKIEKNEKNRNIKKRVVSGYMRVAGEEFNKYLG
jgi:hypothetical protein